MIEVVIPTYATEEKYWARKATNPLAVMSNGKLDGGRRVLTPTNTFMKRLARRVGILCPRCEEHYYPFCKAEE